MPYNRWVPGLPMNIYKLINPLNKSVFYVGRTQRKLSFRILGHLSAGRHPDKYPNKRHGRLISGILESGQQPIIELIQQADGINSEDDFSFACLLEKFWILKYKQMNYSLTNGPTGYTFEQIKYELNMIEKKKRGRPPKIVIEPFNPGNLQKEFDAVNTSASLEERISENNIPENKERILKERDTVSGLPHAYNPYDNPRFKSKNGLDKK